MKILAFAASNSRNSINRQLIQYAVSLLQNAEVEIIDIHDYEMPIFSVDREQELGQPPEAQQFFKKIGEADALLISFAEHNGSYTAAYKNLYDWSSRIDPKVFQGKPMVLLSTSPGPGGAQNVLGMATHSAPYFGGTVKASLSIPSFYQNFNEEAGVLINPELHTQLETALASF
ncbi:NADPH-dependent FMN reductase [Dongshaea marina]|uniref:NADPH-dependent FMN reductase n=1 Tax=Dongshaea marina TaxID=2047966 RepID=UPI000D3E32F3|nr:NAD(P)H-dependent oxidoreductase [Dongshaea marina]